MKMTGSKVLEATAEKFIARKWSWICLYWTLFGDLNSILLRLISSIMHRCYLSMIIKTKNSFDLYLCTQNLLWEAKNK